MSHLVNDRESALDFAATAAAHVEPDGVVIGETYPPDWDPAAALGRTRTVGEATIELLRATVDGDHLDAEVRYGVDGIVWQQPFTARLLDEDGLRELLAAGGLAFERWLERPGFFTARPARPAQIREAEEETR